MAITVLGESEYANGQRSRAKAHSYYVQYVRQGVPPEQAVEQARNRADAEAHEAALAQFAGSPAQEHDFDTAANRAAEAQLDQLEHAQ